MHNLKGQLHNLCKTIQNTQKITQDEKDNLLGYCAMMGFSVNKIIHKLEDDKNGKV